MYWGLILEPQRRYTQVVKKSFRVTMAALDITSSEDTPTQVMVTSEGSNYLICTLDKKRCMNQPLDLCFEEGEKISFATNGNSRTHLTGYLMIDEQEDEDELSASVREDIASEVETTNVIAKGKKRKQEQSISPRKKLTVAELLEKEIDSNSEDDSDFTLSNLTHVDSSDLDDSGEEEEEEDGDEEAVGEEEDDEDDDDAEEEEDEEDDDDDDEEDEEVEEEEEEEPKLKVVETKPNKKQSNKNNKQKPEKTKQGKAEEKVSAQKNGTPQAKKTVEGGVSIEDVKVGNGPVARPGKFIQVYYEGRLKSNNKMFDSANKGNGFEFRLGRQEVIKGWDVGIAGMKVGGKRRIVIPPNMGYGAKGSPPAIPSNATLVFDVELKKVM